LLEPLLTPYLRLQVLNALMQIPSSLAKEGLFTLLAQFNTKYRQGMSRQELSTPQRSKRPRRETQPSGSQNSPPPCVASAAEKASKTLTSLFASSDDDEVRLACNFAVLFMQPPYQSNVLNFLGEGEEGKVKSILALQHILKFDKVKELCALSRTENCVLDEGSLVLKQTVQEVIATLNIWCTNNDAAKAACSLNENFESVETLLTIFCGPPWPEIEVAEPVITAVMRNGSKETREQLCALLQEGSCKKMAEWVVGEIPQLAKKDSDDNEAGTHIAELLLSFMQLGVKLEKLMGWSEDSKLLEESDVDLVRNLLERLSEQLRAPDSSGDLTRNYLRLFSTLVLRSQLTIHHSLSENMCVPNKNGTLAGECIKVIKGYAWLHHCPDFEDLFRACEKLASESHKWTQKPGIPAPTLVVEESVSFNCLTVARDVLLQRHTIPKWNSSLDMLALSRMMLTESNKWPRRAIQAQTMQHSVATLCTLHAGANRYVAQKQVLNVKQITDDKDQQLELLQGALELSEMQFSLLDTKSCRCAEDDMDVDEEERAKPLQILETLLESGIRSPLSESLLSFLSNEEVIKDLEEDLKADHPDSLQPSSQSPAQGSIYTKPGTEGNCLLARITKRVRTSVTAEGAAATMLLLEHFAKSQTLRPFFGYNPQALQLVNAALGSQDREVQLMAMSVYHGLLTDKTDPRCNSLPSKVNRTGAIKVMFSLMAKSPEDKRLHELGLQVAYKLTSKCKDVEYTADEMEIFLRSATKWKEVSIHAPVFGIAMYLSTRPGYKQRLCQLDCVRLVLDAMAEPNQVLVVLQRGQGALRNAARNVMEAGCDPSGFPWQEMARVTTRLMGKYPDDRDFQYRGCGVLVNIASSPPGMAEARNDLDVTIVLKAASRHRKDSELQLWALHFYIQYADREMPANMTGKKGALPVQVGQELVDIMTEHAANDELKVLCITVLEKLLSQYQANAAARQLSDQTWPESLFWKAWHSLNTEMAKEEARQEGQAIPESLVVDMVRVLKTFMQMPFISYSKEWLKDSPEDFTLSTLLEQTAAYVEKHLPQANWNHRDAHSDVRQLTSMVNRVTVKAKSRAPAAGK